MDEKSSRQQDFIRSLTVIVSANLSNEDFRVHELAREAGLSHSSLHHKLKTFTPEEEAQMAEVPTDNLAAYHLFPQALAHRELGRFGHSDIQGSNLLVS